MGNIYESSLTKSVSYTFNVTLLQIVGGTTYSFVAMEEIPEDNPYGT